MVIEQAIRFINIICRKTSSGDLAWQRCIEPGTNSRKCFFTYLDDRKIYLNREINFIDIKVGLEDNFAPEPIFCNHPAYVFLLKTLYEMVSSSFPSLEDYIDHIIESYGE